MATVYNNVHLPRGYEAAIQTDPTIDGVYTDLGVTYTEGSMEFNYDVTKFQGSQSEQLLTFYTNMTCNISISLSQIEMSNLNKIMSGAMNYTTTAGTPVAGATQATTASQYGYGDFIQIANQNGDGSAITVNSVTGATDGALTVDVDYTIVDFDGKYGIALIAGTNITTLAQVFTIDYDYTPSASRNLSAGSDSVEITPRALRLRKNLGTDASPQWFTVVIYAVVNESGLTLSFPRFDNSDPTTIDLTLTGSLDTSRSDLDQLFAITDEYGTSDNTGS